MDNNSQEPIGFYEREYYVFSNFSSFAMDWKGELWMTSEHVYHSERFDSQEFKKIIKESKSAHEAFTFAQENKMKQLPNWDEIKVGIMKEILREKVKQHPYVMKKLLESGDRELVEDSWRDSFWGWGKNKDGVNQLGKLWMEVRKELQSEKL